AIAAAGAAASRARAPARRATAPVAASRPAAASRYARVTEPRPWRPPPPCGEGSGVGARTTSGANCPDHQRRNLPPPPAPPRKGEGRKSVQAPLLQLHLSAAQPLDPAALRLLVQPPLLARECRLRLAPRLGRRRGLREQLEQ